MPQVEESSNQIENFGLKSDLDCVSQAPLLALPKPRSEKLVGFKNKQIRSMDPEKQTSDL